jgi:hypothetical protein
VIIIPEARDLIEERLTNPSSVTVASYYLGRVKFFSFEVEYTGSGYYIAVRMRTNRRGAIPAVADLVRYNEEEGDTMDYDMCKLLNYPEIEIFFLPSNVSAKLKIDYVPY